jgi:hypothetical protein
MNIGLQAVHWLFVRFLFPNACGLEAGLWLMVSKKKDGSIWGDYFIKY